MLQPHCSQVPPAITLQIKNDNNKTQSKRERQTETVSKNVSSLCL